MGELEEKLTSVLNDPSMMAQIMSMAQSLGLGAPPAQQPQPAPMPEPDPVEKMELPDIATIQAGKGYAGGQAGKIRIRRLEPAQSYRQVMAHV